MKPIHHSRFKSGFAVSSSSTKPNPPIIKTKTHLKASIYKQLNSFNFLKAFPFTTFFTQSHNFVIWVTKIFYFFLKKEEFKMFDFEPILKDTVFFVFLQLLFLSSISWKLAWRLTYIELIIHAGFGLCSLTINHNGLFCDGYMI